MTAPAGPRPPVWSLLARAIVDKRAVAVCYHGHQRVLCPHALGWKSGRFKLLSYQTSGATSQGTLSQEPRQRWRSMFVDEIEGPVIIQDAPWHTADIRIHESNCFDESDIEARYS